MTNDQNDKRTCRGSEAETSTQRHARNDDLEQIRASGNRALASLKQARTTLGKAGGWGLVDLFGGGLITGAVKHSYIEQARGELDEAGRDLQAFANLLQAGHMDEDLGVDVGAFLTFADFFCDGIIFDVVVQSRIEKAKRQVDAAIESVTTVLGQLG